MVGLLYEGQNKELSTTSTDLKNGFDVVSEKNNKLYKEIFSNFETIIGHFETLCASSSFASAPSCAKYIKIPKGGKLLVADLEKQEGLLFPTDKFIFPVEPTNIHDVQIVEEVLRETADKVGEAQVLSNGDEHLATKLFPHLIPYGKGSWYWRKMLLLLENITKCVLYILTEDGQMIGFIHFSLLIK
jgi:hypothetical protein